MASGHGHNKTKHTYQSLIRRDTDSDDNPSLKSKNHHSPKVSNANNMA